MILANHPERFVGIGILLAVHVAGFTVARDHTPIFNLDVFLALSDDIFAALSGRNCHAA